MTADVPFSIQTQLIPLSAAQRSEKNCRTSASLRLGVDEAGIWGRPQTIECVSLSAPRDLHNEWDAQTNPTKALLAGLRRLRRTLGVDTALIEPERRVAVGHQRQINQ